MSSIRTVVAESGPFAGFESRYALPFPAILRFLNLIKFADDKIYIEVKAYNSYCLERLWIGPKDVKTSDLDDAGQQGFKKYLYDHGLDVPAFENLVRGVFPARNFIPLPGQMLRGKIKRLSSDLPDDSANIVTIEADVGQLFLIEASRQNVYVHGHWMGKADLRYVFDNG